MKKTRVEHEFERLYGSDEPASTIDYPVLLVCDLPYPGLPIPGVLLPSLHSFDFAPELVGSAKRLAAAITKWQMHYHNSVVTEIHHAMTTKQKRLVHYVKLLPSRRYNSMWCPPHEYDELRAFVRTFPEYRRLPP